MFTTIDKAWAAFLSSAVFIAGYYFDFQLGLGEEAFGALGAVITGLVTYMVPNRVD